MNRLFFKTCVIAVAVAICSSTSWADNRRDNKGDGQRQHGTEQRGQRPGTRNNRTETKAQKNRNKDKSFSDSRRPDNHDKVKPDSKKNNRPVPGQRPGANKPAAPDKWDRNRPSHSSPAHRPSSPHRPSHPIAPPHPAPKPAPRPHPHHGAFVPHHPHAPFYVHAPRPRPHRPAVWRPVGRPISFGQALLGLTLGATFNISLEYLYDSGYTVGGYGSDAIYLNNVSMMNYLWPEASMFYRGGRLVSTVYTYASAYNNASRYNNLLNMLTMIYGSPYVTPTDRGMSSTWWNGDGSYVTLNYESGYGPSGSLGYYTTLTFGN